MVSTCRCNHEPLSNYYAVLGVSTTAGPAGLLHAYHAAVKKHHPDAGGDPTGRKVRAVIEAYTVLKDPQKRRRYDWLRTRCRVRIGDSRGIRAAYHRRRHRRYRRYCALLRFLRGVAVTACVVAGTLLFAAAVAGVAEAPRRNEGAGVRRTRQLDPQDRARSEQPGVLAHNRPSAKHCPGG